MTDNGACYRSGDFSRVLGDGVRHKRTTPRRPQTNGKLQRFNPTLMTEWAHARHYASQSACENSCTTFVHDCNHHQAPTTIGGTLTSRPRSQPHKDLHLALHANRLESPAPHKKTTCPGQEVVGVSRRDTLLGNRQEYKVC